MVEAGRVEENVGPGRPVRPLFAPPEPLRQAGTYARW
jgi:hypothetical protein